MKCLVFCGLNNSKVKAKLYPLVLSKEIDEIFLIRDKPVSLPKVTCYTTPNFIGNNKILKFFFKILCGIIISSYNRISFVLGIYFFPHCLKSLFVGKFCRVHTIASLIGTDINIDIPKSLVFQKILLLFDTITVTGSNTKRKLKNYKIVGNNIHVVPSVINVSFFKPKKTAKKYDLIFLGNLTKNKRLDIVIKAVSKLNSKVNLAVVGQGKYDTFYKKLCTKYGIESTVHFLGFKKDVRKYLSSSKILVLASDNEGLPQCVMEAMSCGIPCVVPNVGDIRDLVSHNQNSLIFERSDAKDLTVNIERLLSDEIFYSYLSRNARKDAVDKVSILGGVKKWNKIVKLV